MLLFRINTNDDSVFGLTTWTLWLAHRGKARSIRRGWYLENITFSGAGEDCSPPDLLQPWGSGETCLACELGGDEVVCLTSGPRPREDPSPLTASCSSVPAIYSGGHTHSSLQPCLFCHNEDFKASALLLTPFLNLFRPRGAGFPTRSRDAWDGVGGGVTTASGPAVPRGPVHHQWYWISIPSNPQEPWARGHLRPGQSGAPRVPETGHGHLSPALGNAPSLAAPVLQLWLPLTPLPPVIPVGVTLSLSVWHAGMDWGPTAGRGHGQLLEMLPERWEPLSAQVCVAWLSDEVCCPWVSTLSRGGRCQREEIWRCLELVHHVHHLKALTSSVTHSCLIHQVPVTRGCDC